MSTEHFKSYLVRDKLFLKELYESNSQAKSRRLITFATDGEISTLMKYLNLLCNGVIKIKSSNFDKIENRHLSAFKKHFEKKTTFTKLLQANRRDKIKILAKFSSVYAHLLAPLFNEA